MYKFLFLLGGTLALVGALAPATASALSCLTPYIAEKAELTPVKMTVDGEEVSIDAAAALQWTLTSEWTRYELLVDNGTEGQLIWLEPAQ